jgi:hypothetical protein
MERADRLQLMLLVAVIILPLRTEAQDLSPGMQQYISVTVVHAPTASPAAMLLNHYSSALVAAYWDYKCPGGGDFTGHGGSSDAALNYSTPAETGGSFQIAAPHDGCEGKVTSVIWADGKEIGDPAVLKEFHDCRNAAWEEMSDFLKTGVFNLPTDKWDPRISVEMLKTKLAPEAELRDLSHHDLAIYVCRRQVLQSLAQSIEDFRSSAATNPDQLVQRRGLFLQYLKEWEQALISPTYPATRTWWNRP